ncbi:hypothetical protein BGZ73_007123 [Actinomortierella ambigua]|nr:hypothetical protein BGZ73_007123 [Actinomortierella ambigua]
MTIPPTPKPIAISQDLELRLMVPEDHDEFVAIFNRVFPREPLGQFFGIHPTEGPELAEAAVRDPISFVVVDRRKPTGQQIVAFGNSKVVTKPFLDALKAKQADPATAATEPVQAILDHALLSWYKTTTVFDRHPQARIMKFMTLGVDEGYGGQKLGTKLLEHTMATAAAHGFEAVIVTATALETQHLFGNRLAFERKVHLRYADFELVVDGVKVAYPSEPEYLDVYEKQLK